MNHTDNRRIARNTFYLYTRTFVAMVVGLYTSRKVLEALGVDDYGIFGVVGGVITMLAFIDRTMTVSIQRYLTFELGRRDFEAYNKVFNTALLIQMATSLLIVVAGETVGLWFVNTQLVIPPERMVAANWVYQTAIIGMVLSVLNAPFSATILAHERMNVTAIVGLVETFLRLAIVLVLVFLPWDRLIAWSMLYMLITVGTTAFNVYYCVCRFPHCGVRLKRHDGLLREMTSFGGWNLIGTIAWTLKEEGANVVLNWFGGPAVNAARSVSFSIKSGVNSLTGGFQNAVNPQLTKNYAAGDAEATHSLLCRSSKISFFLLLLIAVPICIEAPYILRLWLVEVPPYASIFTVLIVAEALCEVFAGPTITTLMATGHIKWYQIVVGSIMLLNIPIAYLLLRLGLPIYVPFIVSTVFVMISQAARLVFMRHLTGLSIRRWLRQVLWPCVYVAVVAVAVPLLIAHFIPEGFRRLVMITAISLAVTAATVWSIGLDNYERTFVKRVIKEKILRKKS